MCVCVYACSCVCGVVVFSRVSCVCDSARFSVRGLCVNLVYCAGIVLIIVLLCCCGECLCY